MDDEDPFNLDEDERPGTVVRCAQCNRVMRIGEDAHELEQGVIGPRGFVSIMATTLLCSDACIRGFVSGTDEQIAHVNRRIP